MPVFPIGHIEVKDADYTPDPRTIMITAIRIQNIRVVLDNSARITIMATTSNGQPRPFVKEMTPMEYSAWGKNDLYVVQWALDKMGLTAKSALTGLWDNVPIDDFEYVETFPTKVIKAVMITDVSFVSGESAVMVDAVAYDARGSMINTLRKKMSGTAYADWDESDEYVRNWLLDELQLTRSN
jgi:hypothetical protein